MEYEQMMDKLYVGMVTYGQPEMTRRAVESLMQTTRDIEIEIVAVIGKPDDKETLPLLWQVCDESDVTDIYVIEHETNLGFPRGVNDIMDYVFGEQGADKLLIVGNDCMAYPDAVEELLYVAGAFPDFDYYSGTEMKAVVFEKKYPQIAETDQKPWLHHWKDVRRETTAWGGVKQITYINGFHNFSLIRKSYFDKVGYVDVSYYPAYFEDVDYVRRGRLAGCKFAEVPMAWYFHYESSTRRTETEDIHQRYFPLNATYYQEKWGGGPGQEHYDVPFAGMDRRYGRLIASGEHFEFKKPNPQFEDARIQYWKWTPRGFKDLHRGQRCVIACNGPSLNDVDMDLLQDEIVFGLNRWHLKLDMKPTYGVCVNLNVLRQWEEIVWMPTVATFIPQGIEELWHPWIYGLLFGPPDERFFSQDIDKPIYQGHTVTYVALQIAHYMGFTDCAIIGMDHDYPRAAGHPTNTPIESEGPDTDHFHEGYFPEGSVWETPNLGRSEEAYRMALEAFEAGGRRIVNASTRTKCDVFPRMDLKEWLDG